MRRRLRPAAALTLCLLPCAPALRAAPPASDQEAKQSILKMPKAQRESLGQLDWSNGKITDAALGVLPAAKHLGTLKLANTGVTDAGLTKLKLIRTLLHLDLSNTAVTDEGIQTCRHLPALRTLVLTGTKVTAEGVRNLRAHRPDIAVQGIVIAAAPPKPDGPEEAKARSDFARLSVSLQRYADRHHGGFPDDLDPVRKELEDESMFVDGGGAPYLYFKGFRKRPKVADSSTAANSDPQAVESLTERIKQKQLEQRRRQATPQAREAERQRWERQKARWAVRPLLATPVTRHGHRMVLYGDGHVAKIDVETYRTQLAQAGLSDATLKDLETDAETEPAEKPKRQLSIFDRMREQFLDKLRAEHPKKILTDPQGRITDLLLSDLPVGDGDLLKLKGMAHLKHLALDRTKVTDGGLAHLAHLKTLERVSLNETAVTAAGVIKLKTVLPALKVDHPSQR